MTGGRSEPEWRTRPGARALIWEAAGRRLAIAREKVAQRILEIRQQVAQKSVDRIVESMVGPPAHRIDRGYIRESLRFIAEASMR
jgi:hypothetical protein